MSTQFHTRRRAISLAILAVVLGLVEAGCGSSQGSMTHQAPPPSRTVSKTTTKEPGPPDLEVLSPKNGEHLRSRRIVVEGRSTPGAKAWVQLDDSGAKSGHAVTGGDGRFAIHVKLGFGRQTVQVYTEN